MPGAAVLGLRLRYHQPPDRDDWFPVLSFLREEEGWQLRMLNSWGKKGRGMRVIGLDAPDPWSCFFGGSLSFLFPALTSLKFCRAVTVIQRSSCHSGPFGGCEVFALPIILSSAHCPHTGKPCQSRLCSFEQRSEGVSRQEGVFTNSVSFSSILRTGSVHVQKGWTWGRASRSACPFHPLPTPFP